MSINKVNIYLNQLSTKCYGLLTNQTLWYLCDFKKTHQYYNDTKAQKNRHRPIRQLYV